MKLIALALILAATPPVGEPIVAPAGEPVLIETFAKTVPVLPREEYRKLAELKAVRDTYVPIRHEPIRRKPEGLSPQAASGIPC